MAQESEVREIIKSFILREFLDGEVPDALTDDAELMSLGVLDSIGVLKLVTFLEERFQIGFQPHQMGKQYIGTLRDITALVLSKL